MEVLTVKKTIETKLHTYNLMGTDKATHVHINSKKSSASVMVPIDKLKGLIMNNWISVDDRLPVSGVDVVVFRPCVLSDDHTDKPIVVSRYSAFTGRFNCHHQPTQWMSISMPIGWPAELEVRQKA